ncbi:MAG: VWA domain-containing protein [Planctomyces sp.]|nr:VWA domain-containing protein [Planctomyces sp.]
MGWRPQIAERVTSRTAAVALTSVLHGTLLMCLALVAGTPRARPDEGLVFNTVWDGTSQADSQPLPIRLDSPGGQESDALTVPPAGAAAGSTDAVPEALLADAASVVPYVPAQGLATPVDALAMRLASLGTGGGEGGGDGEGSGGFFGLSEPGDSIVYVVDCSRSMNHPHPGPAKTRMGRVKLELLKSISGLAPEQKFYILFFNHRPFPMPSSQLVNASEASKAKYLNWMAQARADGDTEPSQALQMAVRLKPDIIYFLTDGDFRRTVVRDVSDANTGNVTIHTIGFGDNRGEPLLKAIAEQSGGKYQFIPPDEIPPERSASLDDPAAR